MTARTTLWAASVTRASLGPGTWIVIIRLAVRIVDAIGRAPQVDRTSVTWRMDSVCARRSAITAAVNSALMVSSTQVFPSKSSVT